MNVEEIKQLFHSNGGIMTTSELKAFGVSAYYIQKYLEKDTITRISHGLYKLNSEMVDEWLEVSRLVEKGIFCLFSAAQLWDLTTFVSSEYHLALPSKAKITMPDYPPIKIYYWHPLHYKIGITVFDQSQFDLPIYDKEKTVCDFLKYRNKVGLDTVKEVVNNYLLQKGRNLDKLMKYAKDLRLANVAKSFLEVLT